MPGVIDWLVASYLALAAAGVAVVGWGVWRYWRAWEDAALPEPLHKSLKDIIE